MASYPKTNLTLDQYFEIEATSELRWEYWDGQIVCMSGASRNHVLICANVQAALVVALQGSECRTFGPEAIDTPALLPYRYPDVSVVCGKPEWRSLYFRDLLVNPVLIVEVESPSSKAVDHGPKMEAYKALTSLGHYLIIAQDRHSVTHWARLETGDWDYQVLTSIDAWVRLTSIDCRLQMSDIYRDVEFTASQPTLRDPTSVDEYQVT